MNRFWALSIIERGKVGTVKSGKGYGREMRGEIRKLKERWKGL
jgi:hypothetical protein